MPPLLRLSVRIAIAFVVIFFAVQPYNWFCQLTQSCNPFSFSHLIPKKKGKLPITVDMQVTDYRKDIELTVLQSEIKTVSNQVNKVDYQVKNLTNRVQYLRPVLHVEPEDFKEYIEFYNCLCNNRYKVKPGQTLNLRMEFLLKDNINYEQKLWGSNLDNITTQIIEFKIRYEAK
ncbi:MAG: cytochrome c oxidase assembly protein [Pseudomonadota bacterium]